MKSREAEILRSVVQTLREDDVKNNSAFLGFDACIDNIVRVVSGKKEEETRFFQTSRQFAEYIVTRGDKSCGIELSTTISKPGGNMVITANALGTLGVQTDCAGTFGLPEILPFFRTMSSNCSLVTIGDTITATALEFENNKVILFDPGPYNILTWESIVKIIGKENLIGLIKDKALVSFLNWSEIEQSSRIWEGFLNDIIPQSVPENSGKIFFTDFSDCSRRSAGEIFHVTELLKRFRKHFRVILSLNQNEADIVATAMGIKLSGDRDERLIESLFKVCGTDILVIHRNEDALGFDGKNISSSSNIMCDKPAVLTGGGDNFNAGFCLAQLKGFDILGSLAVANGVAGYYVRNGASPTLEQLINFLTMNL